MNAPTRLAAYAAGLALLFGGAFAAGSFLVPESKVDAWTEAARADPMDHGASASPSVRGLGLEQDGYRLGEVTAPGRTGEAGTLSFQVRGADGDPLTAYTTSHDKDLHLIVVRSDGGQFRHVHPTMGADGTWSIPWTWTTAGTYRVFADFVPAGGDGAGAPPVTLTRAVDVVGDTADDTAPTAAAHVSTTSRVDGFTVELRGDLRAGQLSDLGFEITRDGAPVRSLEPYLGAFGHLVALRQGDLAYLHVHPEGEEPVVGDLSGPRIDFATEAPTEGRYLLYLDFQVDGRVHTATFVVDAAAGDGTGSTAGNEH
ncbi:heavy-metal-associated domain-containing protein [Frankia sp. CNm7]|uniref:Heavy-metal-associated domain-containing protein n=1 Tax=Frankia nepalensis TaxID=1836974 RepID=A0A937RIB9_9ACTN|nr:heavy-metal-associated domain-containing protein [Frankia nepalensis]MBL7498533.1 heavy-metal-associated domain-containing protein [Frankia nepalensis]MBL7514306.1 heavy-metal-associated domain-containing protein [Frankia nepalensis]MBL7522501.1 heavy-metal-associated domain-containing protein [Frankia nepalensis]MBL7630890.1 heavy-metal-associated domain-containing protein [Frankia nepalensis]